MTAYWHVLMEINVQSVYCVVADTAITHTCSELSKRQKNLTQCWRKGNRWCKNSHTQEFTLFLQHEVTGEILPCLCSEGWWLELVVPATKRISPGDAESFPCPAPSIPTSPVSRVTAYSPVIPKQKLVSLSRLTSPWLLALADVF